MHRHVKFSQWWELLGLMSQTPTTTRAAAAAAKANM